MKVSHFLVIAVSILGMLVLAAGHFKPAVSSGSQKPVLRILFIGNSYTFYNAMPDLLTEVAQSDSEASVNLETHMIAIGGAKLAELWTIPEVQEALAADSPWDYIILQEQSVWAMLPEERPRTRKAVGFFADAIKNKDTQLALFMTWPRKGGSVWYSQRPILKNAEYMHQRLAGYTREIGKETGAYVIPVGDFWLLGSQIFPEIEFYNSDASHPSLAGSYLTSLIFYRYLTQGDPENVKLQPQGLSSQEGQKIRKLAAYGLKLGQ